MIIDVSPFDYSETGLTRKIIEILTISKTIKLKKDQNQYIEDEVKKIIENFNIKRYIVVRLEELEYKSYIKHLNPHNNSVSDSFDKICRKLNDDIDKFGGLYYFLKKNIGKYSFNKIRLTDNFYSVEAGANMAPVLYYINYLIEIIIKNQKNEKKHQNNYKAMKWENISREKIFGDVIKIIGPEYFIDYPGNGKTYMLKDRHKKFQINEIYSHYLKGKGIRKAEFFNMFIDVDGVSLKDRIAYIEKNYNRLHGNNDNNVISEVISSKLTEYFRQYED